ncbi:MAG: BRCT domain-containing protein, partial [Dehalococcoidia bacterium]
RGAMDIEGLGERVAQDLPRLGFVNSIADLYRLKDRRGDLLELDKMGETRVDNLLNAIEATRERPFSRLLFALGIPGVGSESAEWFSRRFKSLELIAIDGVGPIMAQTVFEYLSLDHNKELIRSLIELGINPIDDTPEPSADHPANGVTFVVTGRLETMSRSEAQNRIKSLGGKATGSVTGKTNYLVAGDEAGSKLDKAQRLGVPVISEEQFLEFMDQGLVPETGD